MSISEGFKTKFGEKLNFEPSFLINSPKKDKQVSKRLYIHQKRIPRWAEDLVEVSKEVERQAKTGKDPLSIYGVCVVEQLNTNVIFRLKEDFQRHSSAKWDKEVLGQCR